MSHTMAYTYDTRRTLNTWRMPLQFCPITTTIMPAMQVVAILELLESTVPVHQDETLAAHRHHIKTLEELLWRLVRFVLTFERDY